MKKCTINFKENTLHPIRFDVIKRHNLKMTMNRFSDFRGTLNEIIEIKNGVYPKDASDHYLKDLDVMSNKLSYGGSASNTNPLLLSQDSLSIDNSKLDVEHGIQNLSRMSQQFHGRPQNLSMCSNDSLNNPENIFNNSKLKKTLEIDVSKLRLNTLSKSCLAGSRPNK